MEQYVKYNTLEIIAAIDHDWGQVGEKNRLLLHTVNSVRNGSIHSRRTYNDIIGSQSFTCNS